MAIDAAALLTRVKTIVDAEGTTMTLHKALDAEDYDPSTGDTSEDTDTPAVVKATPPQGVASGYIQGDTIQFGDVETYLPAQDLAMTPVVGMRVSIGSTGWTIVAIDVGRVQDTVVYYRLWLRGGGTEA